MDDPSLKHGLYRKPRRCDDSLQREFQSVFWELQCSLTGAQKKAFMESLIRRLDGGGQRTDLETALSEDSAKPLSSRDRVAAHEISSLFDMLSAKPLPLVSEMPLALHWRGARERLLSPCVAIIGSRHPSPWGRAMARRFGRELARAGISVWSGGAIGIDTEAIQGALETGAGAGVVLGSGLDCLYPVSNITLFENPRISLVSEFPPTHPPRTWTFPLRNFTLAWLTDYTLVIESKEQSGSHITAEWANCLGKGLGALVCPKNHPSQSGNARLHDIGAEKVNGPQDLLSRLAVGAHCLTPGYEALSRKCLTERQHYE